MNNVTSLRLRRLSNAGVSAEGEFVLYWMTAFRRTEWNFSLQRAVDWARELRKPLLCSSPCVAVIAGPAIGFTTS